MAITVRTLRSADAGDAAGVRRSAVPHMVCTAEGIAWEAERTPPAVRLRWLVAEDGRGRIIGCADAGLHVESADPGQGFLHVAVRPQDCGRGAGRALVAAGEEYLAGLGAHTVFTWVADDGRSPGFAERLGYRRRRRARFLTLDLAAAALPPLPDPLPPGVELRTKASFAGDLRPLHEADLECCADEPGEVPFEAVSFEDWLRRDWERPDLDHELSTVVMVDGEVAAYSLAQTDRVSRYGSAMTGTRRAHRGRGLGMLAKLDSLHRARRAGYTRAFTGNDAGNGAMLAINRKLGYRPAADEFRCARELSARPAGAGRQAAL
ncbi:GNAT family N-acetyltransferase [Streptomyces sp. YIM 98790]|uniref:GNAT family N-acetyltransferase n=1 Tax=Streptomyces sp. YIM 98790 TaxID=2689077 RepID=UPI001408FF05|nr:GNAT family N-acetyltransferase [Streptomyces sp. YIM 98790]